MNIKKEIKNLTWFNLTIKLKRILHKLTNSNILSNSVVNTLGTFQSPLTNDIDLSNITSDTIIIWEGNVNPNITGIQTDVIITDSIIEQGIYKLYVSFLDNKIIITPTLIIDSSIVDSSIVERIPMTLNGSVIESPIGTFEFTGVGYQPRGWSQNSYAGDWKFEIDVESNLSNSLMLAISTDGGDTDYNGDTDPTQNGYLLYGGILTDGNIRINNSAMSFTAPNVPTVLQYNAGDKFSLERVSNVVKLYYNSTEVHNYGVHLGSMFVHIAGNGVALKMFNLKKL